MKNILKITLVTLIGLIMFSSCEDAWDPIFKDADGSGTSYVQFSSDVVNVTWPSVNDDNVPEDYSDVVFIKVLGPTSSSDRVMNFSIDPTSTAVVGQHYTLGDTKFTVKANTNYAEIALNLFNDGFGDNEIVDLKLKLTDGDFTLAELATEANYVLKKRQVCLWYDNIILEGDYELDVDGDTWDVSAELNDTGDSLHIYVYWYSSSDRLTMGIDKDNMQLHPEDYVSQLIFWGDAYGGLGRISFDEMTDATVHEDLCNLSFTFKATPYLPDSGYWWGGEFTFTMTRYMTKRTGIKQPRGLLPVVK